MDQNRIFAEPNMKYPVLLAIFSFLIYSNTFHGPFVFDDIPNISENPHICVTQLSFDRLYQAAFSGPCPNRPAAKISFALNYYFHRFRVFGYHWVNILIHVINSVLLYFLIGQILKLSFTPSDDQMVRQIAFFASAFWAVHPVQTQAVSYIVQRMTGMSAMFYIFSLLCYVKARQENHKIKQVILFSAAFAGGILAIGSKEIAATLPFFICICEFYFFHREKAFSRKTVLAVVLILMIFSILIVRAYLGEKPFQSVLSAYDFRNFSLEQRILTQFRVIIFYISLIVYPHPDRLNPEHDFSLSYSVLNPMDTVFSVFAVFSLMMTAIAATRKYPLLSFSIVWFLGNLVIESSVIGLEIVFEHRIYLPSMMIFITPVILAYRWIRTRWLRIEILSVAMIILSVWTYSRNFVWSDDLALWQDSVNKSPHKDRPHVSLGVSYVKRGRFEEAEAHYREALRINPDNYYAHHNLASLLEIESAIAEYSEAIRIHPNYAEAHNNLGVAYAHQGNYRKAKVHFVKALQINAHYKAPYNNLGNILLAEGKTEEAETLYRFVLEIDPEDDQAYNNLGVIFIKKEMYPEAAAQFSEALRLNPDYPDAQKNMALCIKEIQKRKD